MALISDDCVFESTSPRGAEVTTVAAGKITEVLAYVEGLAQLARRLSAL